MAALRRIAVRRSPSQSTAWSTRHTGLAPRILRHRRSGCAPSVPAGHPALRRHGDRARDDRWRSAGYLSRLGDVVGNQGRRTGLDIRAAAGGIENARVLLISNHTHAWLGRGFMEHPVDGTLRLITRSPALAPDAGFYSYPSGGDGMPRLGRIGFSGELLRSERLTNASLRLLPEEPGVLRRVVGGSLRRIGTTARRLWPAKYRLLIDLEQVPHRDNRVALAERRDAFGLPAAALHWRWRDEDQANRERVRMVVAREIRRAGAGRVVVASRVALDPNTHHQLGATRMHPDPVEGVVDRESPGAWSGESLCYRVLGLSHWRVCQPDAHHPGAHAAAGGSLVDRRVTIAATLMSPVTLMMVLKMSGIARRN